MTQSPNEISVDDQIYQLLFNEEFNAAIKLAIYDQGWCVKRYRDMAEVAQKDRLAHRLPIGNASTLEDDFEDFE